MREYAREIAVLVALALFWVGWWFWPMLSNTPAVTDAPERIAAPAEPPTPPPVEPMRAQPPEPPPPAEPVPPDRIITAPIRVVQASDGAPIASIYVTAFPYPDGWRSIKAFIANVDPPHEIGSRELRSPWQELRAANGQYELQLDESVAHWMIIVEEDGFQRQGLDWRTRDIRSAAPTFRLERRETFQVRVIDAETRGLAGDVLATVGVGHEKDHVRVPPTFRGVWPESSAYLEAQQTPERPSYSDRDSALRFSPPTHDGELQLRLSSPWYKDKKLSFRTYDEWKRGVRVRLKPDPLVIQITRNGKPLPSVELYVGTWNTNGTTDENGTAYFHKLYAPRRTHFLDPTMWGIPFLVPPGHLLRCVWEEDDWAATMRLPCELAGGQRVSVPLDGDSTIVCRVTDLESTVPEAQFAWTYATNATRDGVLWRTRSNRRANLNEARWSELPAGDWLLRVGFGWYAEPQHRPKKVSAMAFATTSPGETTVVDIDLTRMGRLLCRVENLPVSEEAYLLFRPGATRRANLDPCTIQPVNDMLYAVEHVMPGQYTVCAATGRTMPADCPCETLDIVEGRETRVTLVLPDQPETTDATDLTRFIDGDTLRFGPMPGVVSPDGGEQ